MIVVQYAILSAPLFAMVLLGYLLGCWSGWQRRWTAWLSKLVMNVILPGLLFHTMSDLRSLPPVNARLLIAFFGGCGIVFLLGRLVAARVFKLDGASQSIFATFCLACRWRRPPSASNQCHRLRSSSCSMR
jgi:malonate transporter